MADVKRKRTWSGESDTGELVCGDNRQDRDDLAAKLRRNIKGVNNTLIREIVIKTLEVVVQEATIRVYHERGVRMAVGTDTVTTAIQKLRNFGKKERKAGCDNG